MIGWCNSGRPEKWGGFGKERWGSSGIRVGLQIPYLREGRTGATRIPHEIPPSGSHEGEINEQGG